MKIDKKIEEAIVDAVLDMPREFYVGKRRFRLWSPSLGMSIMLERRLNLIGLDLELKSKNPYIEVLFLVRSKRTEICDILSVCTFRHYRELRNPVKLKRRSDFFSRSLSDEEVAELFLAVLSLPKAETLISGSGILKQQKEQSRIARQKNIKGHSRTYGGVTIYGSLIDLACKSYGWTKEYVVWGIDLISLRLMMADAVNTIYLSEEEMREMHLPSTMVLDANNPDNMAEILAMNWD